MSGSGSWIWKCKGFGTRGVGQPGQSRRRKRIRAGTQFRAGQVGTVTFEDGEIEELRRLHGCSHGFNQSVSKNRSQRERRRKLRLGGKK